MRAVAPLLRLVELASSKRRVGKHETRLPGAAAGPQSFVATKTFLSQSFGALEVAFKHRKTRKAPDHEGGAHGLAHLVEVHQAELVQLAARAQSPASRCTRKHRSCPGDALLIATEFEKAQTLAGILRRICQ